jgi:hypothetical protein
MRARLTQTFLVVAVLAVGVVVSACGSDDGAPDTGAATSQAVPPTTQPPAPATMTGPVASTPDGSPPPPPTVTDIPTSTVPPPAATTPTPEEEQGGGGEESIRVPAAFAIRGGALTPPQVTVPPRLAVELSVSSDEQPHTVVLRTPDPRTLEVEAGGRASVRMPGLRAGSYTIAIDGRAAGELVVGGEVGP